MFSDCYNYSTTCWAYSIFLSSAFDLSSKENFSTFFQMSVFCTYKTKKEFKIQQGQSVNLKGCLIPSAIFPANDPYTETFDICLEIVWFQCKTISMESTLCYKENRRASLLSCKVQVMSHLFPRIKWRYCPVLFSHMYLVCLFFCSPPLSLTHLLIPVTADRDTKEWDPPPVVCKTDSGQGTKETVCCCCHSTPVVEEKK